MKALINLLLILALFYKSADAKGSPPYDFKLLDNEGKYVRLSDFKGKVVVMDFWFTGCINCMNFYRTSLSNAEQQYAQSKDVVFISICIDKDKTMWLKSLEKGRYASKASVNLYTGGQGNQHPVIKDFGVSAYPQPIIIGKKGELLSRSDHLTNEKELTATITNALKKV